ncbi:hypothetical protein PENSPDRAFT_471295 [Peniophora sp. CONT]|nr:hypothetical protein PENSPDRAFT_471295 [Peniophora sp. CONT]
MSELPSADVPVPRFKYMENPGAYMRDIPVAQIPGAGDFVVLSIDPVASVAHLDEVARQAAKRLRRRRYVGLIMLVRRVCISLTLNTTHDGSQMEGLAMEDVPANQFVFTFVRKGLPPTSPPDSFIDMCIPILPNTYHPTNVEPLRPLHPLPWQDCYISFTNQLNYRNLRVKTTPRDYTGVLPVDDSDEIFRLDCMIDDSAGVVKQRMLGLQEGSLEAISTIPLPDSPVSSHPVFCSAPMENVEDQAHADAESVSSLASSSKDRLDAVNPDDISMIGSIESDVSQGQAKRPALSQEADIGFLHAFESMIDSTGSVNNPVVDIWYDLDMVKDVPDVSLFVEECAQIRRIIDDAEERLGIRAAREAAAAKENEFYAQLRLAKEANSAPGRVVGHRARFLGKLSGKSSDPMNTAYFTELNHKRFVTRRAPYTRLSLVRLSRRRIMGTRDFAALLEHCRDTQYVPT